MIDEKKLIEELRMEYECADDLSDFTCGVKRGLSEALTIVKYQQKVGEWIPVEERLPGQSLNSVIGWDTYRERCVFVQYYMNEWVLGNHESVNIVAWQPLPEPYKGETE